MKKLLIAALLATLGVSTAALADNVVETLSNDGGFKVLLKVVKASGMESTLTGAGPVTVFAPTDFAFEKMPKDKLDALTTNQDEAKKLLSLHLVNGAITKADVDAGKVKTMSGQVVTLSVEGGVKIDGIPVVGPGIHADNGTIHSLTGVLSPKK